MKILQLSFSNLNSLRGAFSIDFEKGPLAESSLFAITGPTGVGKTTILDAITLGLFGKAARYDNHRSSTPENMMSRGTGECFSEVVFSCKSGVYSVRWDLARARKKPDGKVQAAKRQIATLDGEILHTKIREVDQCVVELTGLDYNRFLRSVLLAQGRFKEFLDAGRNERGELLEKITGTKIYSDLSKAAFRRAQEQQAGIDKAKLALEGIRLLDVDTVKAHTEEKKSTERQLVESEKSLKLLTDRITLYDRMIELNQEKKSLSEQLESWEKETVDFAPNTKRIQTFDRASPLSADLSKWKELGGKSKEIALQKQNSERRLVSSKEQFRVELSKVITLCTHSNQAIELKHTQQHDLLKKEEQRLVHGVEWLKMNPKDEAIEAALPQLRSQGEACRALAQKNATLAESVVEIKARILKTKTSISTLEAQRIKADKVLKKKSTATENCAVALKDTLAGNTKETCQKNLTTARERLVQANELQRFQEDYLSESISLKDKRASEKEEVENIEAIQKNLNVLANKLEEQRTILKDKETIHLQATSIASLQEKRTQLKDGEPCDLCGSTEHPYALGNLPLPGDTEQAWDAQIQIVNTQSTAVNKQNTELAAKQAMHSAISKACSDLEDRIAKHEKAFEEGVLRMNASLTVANKNPLVAFAKEETKENQRLETLVKTIETNEKNLTEAEKRQASAWADLNSIGEQLKQLEQTANDTVKELDKEEKQVIQAVIALGDAMKEFSLLISDWLPACKTPDETKTTMAELELRSKTFIQKRKQELETRKRIDDSIREAKRLGEEQQRIIREKNNWESKLLTAKIDLQEFNHVNEIEPWDESERRSRTDRVTDQMTRAESEFNLKKAELKSITAELEDFSKHLQASTLKMGIESLLNLDTVLSDKNTIDSFRLQKRALEDRKTKIVALANKNDELISLLKKKHIPEEAEVEQLRRDAEAGKNQRNRFSERSVELRIALETDAKARIEQRAEVERISDLEKEASPWLVLRDLIGSADGNAFSRFAQGLTLAQLVVYANKHLRELNPRYRIHRVADADLELEIVDCYEANAIRPTRSLSGGESFLVSLALALGLSELAGRNTKIESLFIDEGFGSLDTDTLDVALSALENLRLQNRMIGVISHVEELKTRVGTQIQVILKANGHAALNIVE